MATNGKNRPAATSKKTGSNLSAFASLRLVPHPHPSFLLRNILEVESSRLLHATIDGTAIFHPGIKLPPANRRYGVGHKAGMRSAHGVCPEGISFPPARCPSARMVPGSCKDGARMNDSTSVDVGCRSARTTLGQKTIPVYLTRAAKGLCPDAAVPCSPASKQISLRNSSANAVGHAQSAWRRFGPRSRQGRFDLLGCRHETATPSNSPQRP